MNDKFLSNLLAAVSIAGQVENRLLAEYGAVFAAQGVTVPEKIVFRDEAEVAAFQSKLSISGETISGMRMELQSAAMQGLQDAIEEARENNLSITPRDIDSARRSYSDTVGLWASRVEPALDHWVRRARLSVGDASRIRSLSPFDQVPEVLKLEEEGIYFAKDLSKSILYSVAPPGASQHLSLLAFDVKEYDVPQVREILMRNKWFQTVVSDLPHFTYLGVEESKLPLLGLKCVKNAQRRFWVPDLL